MRIYLFGNQDVPEDSWVFMYLPQLEHDFPKVEFLVVKPNEDLPFLGEKKVIIMDAVEGISQVKLIREQDFEKFKLSPRTSVHDFDLGFQLKYLKKLGKLGETIIIGIPMTGNATYSSIHSIVKKLVAQDIQGS